MDTTTSKSSRSITRGEPDCGRTSCGRGSALAMTALLVAAAAVPAARADQVTEWNERGVAAGYTAAVGNSVHSRNLAIMHIAMFEAVNSIEPRYTPYRQRLSSDPGASREAAAASAAHYSLVRLFPGQAKDFQAAFDATIASIPDGPARASGVRLGEQAAAAMLAERAKDGADAPITYRSFAAAGRYVPTVVPLSSTWGAVKPFALATGDAVRPPAPYRLNGAEWTKDFEEVRTMGARTGSKRTAEQTEIARFWQLSGPATYDPVVRQIASAKKLDLLDRARLFALTSIATADAAIAVFEAKYAYGFWRPITAIRNADVDGNDATNPDVTWEPFIPTPMHPEYPCAHCIFQGSAAGVMQALYGDTPATFSITSNTAPGVTRRFAKLSDYVAEVVNARVYEGVHYRTSGEVGADMGRRIAEHTVKTQLRPLP